MARKAGTVRGFGVLLPDWIPERIDEGASTFSEEEPLPGRVVATSPGADPRAVPEVVGVQARGVEFAGTRASGNAGIGTNAGTLAWRLPGESDAQYRHHIPPTQLTGAFGPFYYLGADTQYDAVAFPLSGVVMKCAPVGATTAPADQFVRWNPHDSSWTFFDGPTRDTFGPTASVVDAFRSCLVVIPRTDRVVLVLPNQGLAWYSDDFGDNWLPLSAFAPLDAIGDFPRMAFDGAGKCMLVSSGAGDIKQWVSVDLCATWQVTQSATTLAQKLDIAAHPNGSIVGVGINNDDELIAYIFGGGETRISEAETITLDNAATWEGACIGVDDDGVVWVYASNDSLGRALEVWWSEDGGATYTKANGSTVGGTVFGGDATNDRWVRGLTPRVVFANGQGFLFSQRDSSSPNNDPMCYILGGWEAPMHTLLVDSLGNPTRALGDRFQLGGAAAGTATYVPYQDLSTATDWTSTTTGTGTIARTTIPQGNQTGLVVTGAAGDTAYGQHTEIVSGTNTGAFLSFSLMAPNDGAGSPVDVTVAGVSIHVSNKIFGWFVDIGTNGVRIRQSGNVGSVENFTLAPTDNQNVRLDFRVHLDPTTNVVTLFYREVLLGTTPYATQFTKITHTLLTVTGLNRISTTDVTVRFGIPFSVSRAVEAVFNYMEVRLNIETTASQNPDETTSATSGWGKGVGFDYAYPLPEVYDHTAQRVSRFRVRGATIIQSDSFTAPVQYAFPVEALFPTYEPSPDRVWKSNQTAALVNQDLVMDASSDGKRVTFGGTFGAALVVRNTNSRKMELAGWNGVVWDTLGIMDLAVGFTDLEFTRGVPNLKYVLPNVATASGARFIRAGELVGGHVLMWDSGAGETEADAVSRRIVANSAGFWTGGSAGTVQKPVIELETLDGTEPTSGDCHLVWPSGVLFVHEAVSPGNTYSQYRVRFIALGAGDLTAPGFRVGDLGLYELVVPGKQWAHGWTVEQNPNVRVVEDDYGSQRRTQRGPTRRIVTFAWDHGARGDAIDGRTTGDYIGARDSSPLATDQDLRGQLEYLWTASEGTALPVVAFYQILGDGETLTDPRLFVSGYLDGTNRLQEAAGRGGEGVDSFYRMGPVRLVERV